MIPTFEHIKRVAPKMGCPYAEIEIVLCIAHKYGKGEQADTLVEQGKSAEEIYNIVLKNEKV